MSRNQFEIRKLLGVCTRCGNEMAVAGLLGKRCRRELRPRPIRIVFDSVYKLVDRVTNDWKGHRSLAGETSSSPKSAGGTSDDKDN